MDEGKLRWYRRGAGALVASVAAAGALAAPDGKAVYERTCIACHGADGKGRLPGVPPLGGPTGRLAKSDAVLIKSIMDGVQSRGSPFAMPPKGGDAKLTEEDAAASLQYIRTKFAQ